MTSNIFLFSAQIVFVTYDNYWYLSLFLVLRLLVVHLNALEEIIAPAFYALVTFATSKIKHNNATVSSPVEGIAKTLKSLLTSSIPNL